MEEFHAGTMVGHFSGVCLYKTPIRRWWWKGMYSDCVRYCKSCPQCAVVTGSGRRNPPLRPISVDHMFQIVGVDIMELPKTK